MKSGIAMSNFDFDFELRLKNHGREKPEKSGDGIFGCIPHVRGALPESGGGSDMNADYVDMLRCLNRAGVDYMLVGGWAVNMYGYIRATVDLDIWILADADNAKKVYAAVAEFGAPVSEMKPDEFAEYGMIFQIGVAPCRVDIISKISGVSYADAVTRAVSKTIDGIPVRIISLEDLIANKKASGRAKDLADVEVLEGCRK